MGGESDDREAKKSGELTGELHDVDQRVTNVGLRVTLAVEHVACREVGFFWKREREEGRRG